MGEWFCEVAGRRIGPLSSHQLKAMADSGRILPTDRVRQGAAGDWIAAGQVRGLFPVGPAPPPVEPQPDEPAADEVVPPEIFAAPADDASVHAARNLAALLHQRRRRQQQTLAAGSMVLLILGLLVAAFVVKYGDITGLTGSTDSSEPAVQAAPAKVPLPDHRPSVPRPTPPPETAPPTTDENEHEDAVVQPAKPAEVQQPQSESARQPEMEKRRAPQPGTPEYDFGISADDKFAPD